MATSKRVSRRAKATTTRGRKSRAFHESSPAKRVMVQRVLVPVITERELSRIEALADRLDTLQVAFEEVEMELNASLSVLRGTNHPDGWTQIVVVDEVGVVVKELGE